MLAKFLDLILVWVVVVLVLGLAAITWHTVRSQFHGQVTQSAQAKRSADWVGEKVPPKSPIQIVVHNSNNQCLHIEEVHVNNEPDDEFDYGRHGLVVFVRRVCGHAGDYAEAHYRVEAADGTVIDSGYTNWEVDNSALNQKSEWDIAHSMDGRATKIILWTSDSR